MYLFIDTNVYLKFYHYSNEELEELKKLIFLIEDKQINLLIPRQVLNEFNRNRELKIADALKTFKEEKLNSSFPIFMKEYSEYEVIKNAISEYITYKKKLLEVVNFAIENNSLKADLIINEIFNFPVIIENNDELINAARIRFDLGNPPGKKNSYGDALNWEILLRNVPFNNDLIFISDDKDYYSELDSSKFNKYLKNEWNALKNSNIIYFKSISDFFKNMYPNIKLASDLQKDLFIEKLENSNTFRTARNYLHKLSKFENFTSDQINRIFFQSLNNSQIYWISEDEDINEILYTMFSNYKNILNKEISKEFQNKIKNISKLGNDEKIYE